MLKPLFIKRKQLNFQKHIGRATLTALKRIQRDKAYGLGCLRVNQHRPGGFAREQGQGACVSWFSGCKAGATSYVLLCHRFAGGGIKKSLYPRWGYSDFVSELSWTTHSPAYETFLK